MKIALIVSVLSGFLVPRIRGDEEEKQEEETEIPKIQFSRGIFSLSGVRVGRASCESKGPQVRN